MRALVPILMLLWAAPVAAQTSAERYDYEVSWGYSDVARVTMQRGCPRDGYVPAKMTAKSLGVISQLHEFEIRLDSFTDSTGRALEGRTFIEEEGVPRHYRSRFAQDGATFTRKTFREKDSTQRLKLRAGADDLLSWFFALRGRDITAGQAYAFHVWDGWKLTRITARVGTIGRVWTPSGTFRAHPISLARVRLHHHGSNAYTPRSDTETLGTIWLSADEARTPVAMDFRAPVGLAKLRLTRQKVSACRESPGR